MDEHDQTPQEGGEQSSDRGTNAEAAKWRRALRDAEADRDRLRERLDVYDRREVDQLAATKLTNPDDLWLATSLDALRDEEGSIDMTLAAAEVDRVAAERPHWRKVDPPLDLHQGVRLSKTPEPPSFGQAVKKALGGG